MSVLLSLKRLLRRGPGMAVLFQGPAGIGKTYQLEQFLHTFPARVLLVDAAEPLSRLPERLAQSRHENAWASGFLARLAAGESVRMPDAAAAFGERLAHHAPIVVVADHFHRASASQQAFWLALGERMPTLKQVGLVCVSRTEGPKDWPTQTISGLDVAESEALVASLLPFAVPAGLMSWLHEKAQGNPLYLKELVGHLQRIGAFEVRSGMAGFTPPQSDSLPQSLTALIRSLWPDPMPLKLQALLSKVLLQTNAAGEIAAVNDKQLSELKALGLLSDTGLIQPLYREVLLPLLPQELVVKEVRRLMSSGQEVDALLLEQLTVDWPLPETLRTELLNQAARQAASRLDFLRAGQHWERAAQLDESRRGEFLWLAAQCLSSPYVEQRTRVAQLQLEAIRWQLARGQTVSQERWSTLVSSQGDAKLPLEELADVLPGGLNDHWRAQHTYGWIAAPRTDERVGNERLELWQSLNPQEQRQAPPTTLSAVALAIYSKQPDEATRLWHRAIEQADAAVTRIVAQANLGLIPIMQYENLKALTIFQQAGSDLVNLMQSPDCVSGSLDAHLLRSRAEHALHSIMVNSALLLFRLGESESFESLMQERVAFAMRRQSLPRYVNTANRLADGLIELGHFAQAQEILLSLYPTGFERISILTNLVNLYAMWNNEDRYLLLHYLHELSDQQTDDIEAQMALMYGWTVAGHFEQADALLKHITAESEQPGSSYVRLHCDWVRSIWLADQGRAKEAALLARQVAQAGQQQDIGVNAQVYAMWASSFEGQAAQLQADVMALEKLGRHGAIHALRSRQRPVALRGPSAYLEVLGTPHLFDAQGQEVKSQPVMALLSALLCARLTGEEGVGALPLAEHLFAGQPEAQANSKLARLVARTQGLLGEAAVVRSGEQYMLRALTSDAETFLAQNTDDLWRGPFLGGLVDPLLEPAAHLLLTRLQARAEELLPIDAARAADLANILIKSEPYSLEHLALLVRAHDLAGQPRRAGALYRQAKQRFEEVGEELPQRWQDFLLENTPVAVMVEQNELQAANASLSSQARQLAVHPSTVQRWKTGQTKRPGQPGRPPQLTDEEVQELLSVTAQPPSKAQVTAEKWTLKVTAQYVEDRFGVQLSLAQLSRLLRRGARGK